MLQYTIRAGVCSARVRQLKAEQQLYVVSVAVFELIKLIRDSESAGAMRVIFCIVH
jgi:hypothetical protein